MENKKNKAALFIEKATSLIENVNKMATIVDNFIAHDKAGDPNLTAENRAAVLAGAIAKLKAMDAEEMTLVRLLPRGYKQSNKPFGSLLIDRELATEASTKDLHHVVSLLEDCVHSIKHELHIKEPVVYKESARAELAAKLYAAHVCLKSWQYRMMYVVGR